MPFASRWTAQLLPSQSGVRNCDKFADTTGLDYLTLVRVATVSPSPSIVAYLDNQALAMYLSHLARQHGQSRSALNPAALVTQVSTPWGTDDQSKRHGIADRIAQIRPIDCLACDSP